MLVCEAALPSVIPFMPFLGGLCTERGGTLSITSGYARMYEVPAVVGVKGLMGVIRNGDVIRIDGSMGTVGIIREGTSGEGLERSSQECPEREAALQ
ncbi:MAG: PEP-utilizing enzyme [Desulfatiglandales bacterium]